MPGVVKQPQTPAIGFGSFGVGIKNKIGTPFDETEWWPPDFLLDPQTSQIKVKSMWGQVFTFVRQTTTQIKSRVCQGIPVVPPYTPAMPSFVPHEVTTPTYFRPEVWFRKA